MPTGHEAYVFLAVCCEGYRCGLSAGGELVLPQHLAGLDVNRADEIVCCGRNEDEPAGCDQGSAVVGGAYLNWQQRWNPERAVGASLAERRVPQGFSSLHIDRANAAIGWLSAHQLGPLPLSRIDLNGVRQPRLRSILRAAWWNGLVLLIDRQHAFVICFATRQQAVEVSHLVVIGDEDTVLGVDSDAAPVRSAVVTRVFNEVLVVCRGCIFSLIDRAVELDATPQLVEGRHAPHVLFRERPLGQRVIGRVRLRRRKFTCLHAAGRCFALFDGEQWRTRTPIENIDLALLAWQNDRRDGCAIFREVHQCRLRAKVIIPNVMMYRLKVPSGLPRGHVNGDKRAAELVLASRALGAIVVARGVAEWYVTYPSCSSAAAEVHMLGVPRV